MSGLRPIAGAALKVKEMAMRERYRYTPLPAPNITRSELYQDEESTRRRRKLVKLGAAVVAFVLVLYWVFTFVHPGKSDTCEAVGNCTDTSSHIWGQYSPWFSVPSEYETTMPKGCELTFASVLSRHGSRDPTAKKTVLYRAVIDKIHKSATKYSAGYEFIKDYSYGLGADELTGYGKGELVDSGATFYDRYSSLVADPQELFVRAAGSERVIESSKYFLQGYYEAQGRKVDDHWDNILVLPEGDGYNNTLDHGGCPRFSDGPWSELGHDSQNRWRDVWLPSVRDRLNKKLPGANLSLDETIFIMDLCPFNTVATSNGTHSQFCRLFSEEEWRSYDYYESLDKWYGQGPGNPIAPSQGIGYVNELIARLTGQAVQDNTNTNRTLDASPKTFPLNRTLYADFSHDNMMMSIYAAMGLYSETEALPKKYKVPPQKLGGFSASWAVPFAGRMYVEKMRCSNGRAETTRTGRFNEEFVRILVNDRVVPLRTCKADYLGRCKLSDFLESLSFAKSGGRWHECFEK